MVNLDMPFEPGARILLDSINSGTRITTFLVMIPRPYLPQLNTHGIVSKNAESSRAVKISDRLKMVEENPFFPEFLGKNQKGMQAYAELGPEKVEAIRQQWEALRAFTIERVRDMAKLGMHKQDANRYLEPFLWQRCILTATTYENMINLRKHHAAQPGMQQLALAMEAALAESTPVERDIHAPLAEDYGEHSLKVSAARCARISYTFRDGQQDLTKELALFDRLLQSKHMSPMEHQAIALKPYKRSRFSPPWVMYRKTIAGEDVFRPEEAP